MASPDCRRSDHETRNAALRSQALQLLPEAEPSMVDAFLAAIRQAVLLHAGHYIEELEGLGSPKEIQEVADEHVLLEVERLVFQEQQQFGEMFEEYLTDPELFDE